MPATREISVGDTVIVHFDATTTLTGTYSRVSFPEGLLVIIIADEPVIIQNYWYFTKVII